MRLPIWLLAIAALAMGMLVSNMRLGLRVVGAIRDTVRENSREELKDALTETLSELARITAEKAEMDRIAAEQSEKAIAITTSVQSARLPYVSKSDDLRPRTLSSTDAMFEASVANAKAAAATLEGERLKEDSEKAAAKLDSIDRSLRRWEARDWLRWRK